MLNNPNPLLRKAEWCRYCIHLTNLNLNHFKVVEAMGLEVAHEGPLQWHHLLAKFHPSLSAGSKIISRDTDRQTHTHTHTHTHTYTDRQTGDLISLLSFSESRLKCANVCVAMIMTLSIT
jgi:hypothetical protein